MCFVCTGNTDKGILHWIRKYFEEEQAETANRKTETKGFPREIQHVFFPNEAVIKGLKNPLTARHFKDHITIRADKMLHGSQKLKRVVGMLKNMPGDYHVGRTVLTDHSLHRSECEKALDRFDPSVWILDFQVILWINAPGP